MNDQKQIRQMYFLSFGTMVITFLIGVIGSIVDGVIIGRCLGTSAMASYGLTSPVTGLMMLLGSVVVSGASLLCVQFMSRGDMTAANGVFTVNILIGAIVAIAFTAAVLLFSGPLVMLLGAKESATDLFDQAQEYLVGLSIGFIFSMGSMVLHPYLNLEGDRIRTIAAVIISLIVNISSDLICIFVLHTGLFGIAIATVLSQLAGFLVSLSHFTADRSLFRLSFRNIPWKMAKDLLSGGSPMAVNRLCFVIKTIWMNRIVLMIAGTSALSAISVMNNLYNFISIASLSSAMAMMTVAGMLEGEHDRSAMSYLLKTGIKAGVFINGLITVIVFAFAGFFAGIYAEGDGEVISYATTCLKYFATSLIFLAIAQIYICYLLGSGRKKLTVFYMLMHNLVLPIGCAYVLGTVFGLEGFWASFVICEVIMLAVFSAAAAIRNRKFITKPDDYMFLTEEFDISDDRQLKLSPKGEKDVADISEKAYLFLKEQGVDERRCFITSLSIEEMTKNIFEHGKRDNKILVIYERLVVNAEGRVELRIRDNGKRFDPKTWLSLYDEKDVTHNVGINMISKMATDFRYMNSMGLNVLIIEV